MHQSQRPSSSSSGTVCSRQRQHFDSVSNPFPRTWTPQPGIDFLQAQVSADHRSQMSEEPVYPIPGVCPRDGYRHPLGYRYCLHEPSLGRRVPGVRPSDRHRRPGPGYVGDGSTCHVGTPRRARSGFTLHRFQSPWNLVDPGTRLAQCGLRDRAPAAPLDGRSLSFCYGRTLSRVGGAWHSSERCQVEPITSNMDLRVQALSCAFHDQLVRLAVRSPHPGPRHIPRGDRSPHLLHRLEVHRAGTGPADLARR
jgi:hypothetical protein